MTTKREDLDHVRTGGRIICGRRSRRPRRCYACAAEATVICDHPLAEPRLPEGLTAADLADLDEQTRLELTTCSRPCCGRHGCWLRGQQHLCKEHAIEKGVWCG